jgi:hypothetical protein
LYDDEPGSDGTDGDCQVVEAPEGPPGAQLIPSHKVTARDTDGDDEIRLTYRELTALIEDAVKQLR